LKNITVNIYEFIKLWKEWLPQCVGEFLNKGPWPGLDVCLQERVISDLPYSSSKLSALDQDAVAWQYFCP